MNAQVMWIVGMVGSVAASLAGVNLPEPYNHYVMIAGVVSAAITGYQVQHPPPARDVWTPEQREANAKK